MSETLTALDERMRALRERCAHTNRLKGLPSGTFDCAHLCLDCGQFLNAGNGNGEPIATTAHAVKMAIAKLRFMADALEGYLR